MKEIRFLLYVQYNMPEELQENQTSSEVDFFISKI